MFSSTSISEFSAHAAVVVLAPLGLYPLLGPAFTGFLLGGLPGFKQPFACASASCFRINDEHLKKMLASPV